MGYGIQLEVYGPYALFSRPEMKVERVSYDVITPSAARGILESIYWKPAIKWVIDRIAVYNPITITNFRRNEVSSKLSARNIYQVMKGGQGPLYLNTAADRQQRAAVVLKDVRYVISAHFEMTEKAGETDTVEKHYNIALRRMRKGQCYQNPYLGCKEFPAFFRLVEEELAAPTMKGERDLGYMLYDMNYENSPEIYPTFFRGMLKDGVLDLTNCEVMR